MKSHLTKLYRVMSAIALSMLCVCATADEDTIGSREGEPFVEEMPPGARMTAIDVYFESDGISGLLVHYQLPNGLFNMLSFIGSREGKLHVYVLSEGDAIISVGGTLNDDQSIRSLTFKSRQGTSGSIGPSEGSADFLFVVPDGAVFTGLKGLTGDRLNRIGIIFSQTANPVQETRMQPEQSASAPVVAGWTITTRDFICISNGSEYDSIAEIYGDLTLALDVGNGKEMAFLMSRSEEYPMSMDCGTRSPLNHERFTHVNLNIPAVGKPRGDLWFVAHLREADAGNFFDPHDDLGEYETVLMPVPLDAEGVSIPIDFTGPDTGYSALRITLDVKPYFKAGQPVAPVGLELSPSN